MIRSLGRAAAARIRRFRFDAWANWPQRAYRDLGLQARMAAVGRHLSDCLDRACRGRVTIISICAGDGRNVIGVLQSHARRHRATAWLVEINQQLVLAGRKHAAQAGIADVVHCLQADATDFATYRDIAPADIVLLCGVWGHVPAGERRGLVEASAALCKPGGALIWTRGVRRGILRMQEIQSLFDRDSWQQEAETITNEGPWAVVTERYRGPALPLPAIGALFHFRRNAGY